jgi:hypothetical protein
MMRYNLTLLVTMAYQQNTAQRPSSSRRGFVSGSRSVSSRGGFASSLGVSFTCNRNFPKRSFMYLTVSSWFLLSFVMEGGGGVVNAVMLLNRTSVVMLLNTLEGWYGPWNLPKIPPLCPVKKCQVFGPQMALAYQLDVISHGPKILISRAQQTPSCPRNRSARIKNITHWAVQIIGS